MSTLTFQININRLLGILILLLRLVSAVLVIFTGLLIPFAVIFYLICFFSPDPIPFYFIPWILAVVVITILFYYSSKRFESWVDYKELRKLLERSIPGIRNHDMLFLLYYDCARLPERKELFELFVSKLSQNEITMIESSPLFINLDTDFQRLIKSINR